MTTKGWILAIISLIIIIGFIKSYSTHSLTQNQNLYKKQ